MSPISFKKVSFHRCIYVYRFTVEVADFNFGPQYADYMTFRERLRDSIMNTFTRTGMNTEENEGGPIWPPNQKYGSMPRF